jgi:ADP-heptose:LPS heptosyltransferase
VRGSDRAVLQSAPQIRDFSAALMDFSDTAALCDLMDLVISVDTSAAHLAGAMGRPLWVMLSFSHCWRWLRKREDSPWYPSAKLYRQRAFADWDGVLADIGQDLQRKFSATTK